MNDLPNRDVTIFTEAVYLPADQRAAYLERACGGDSKLRHRVEALLQTHDHVGDFLEESPQKGAIEARMEGPTSEKPGDRIGRYKLLQQIGEGGCGVVYMAEQEEPVRRRVALKIIKLGMDTKGVIARFEAERQALALMDHPNIAKVFDAGATESGRPYFVMQLIRGDKITEYCDQHSLSTKDRLKLFIQVCQAVQHAHQKGIIHRDIKPSNILVTTTAEGDALPVVIDFGIAKATTNQPLTDKTLFTAFEMLIGTPAYMSPEQAALANVEVDTRTDIYSLGVLLYELLTSSTPFEVGELLKKGLDETRRVIREQEPPRPSTRLSKMTSADLTTVAQHRKSEPPILIRGIRGDLDWIAMKALEKDRNRRYETANGLALDVQHYMADEAVSACPPSATYRFQKLVLRNRLLFSGLGVIALLLVAGLGILWSLLTRERVSHREAESARIQARTDQKKAETESVKSQQVTHFLEKMLQGVGPSVARGRDTTMLREVLDETSERLGPELSKQSTIEAELRGVLGRVYSELGVYSEAESEHRRAVEILRKQNPRVSPELASALNDLALALFNRGHYSAAEAAFREALAIRKRIYGNEHPTVAATLKDLAGALWYQSKMAEAETLIRESRDMRRRLLGSDNLDVADSLNALSVILAGHHDYSNETLVSRQVLEIRRKLLPTNHPLIATSLYTLGYSLYDEEKYIDAEGFVREALVMKQKILGDKHPDLANCHSLLGRLLMDQGKLAEAEVEFRSSLQIQQNFPFNQNFLSYALDGLIKLLLSESKIREAEQVVSDVLVANQVNPANRVYLFSKRADLLARQGRWREAVTDAKVGVESFPSDHTYYHTLAPLLVACGDSNAYYGFCQTIVARFGATTNFIVADRMAKDCLCAPVPDLDLKVVGQLATLAVTQGTNDVALAFFQACKAMAEYRQGNYEEATVWAKKSLENNFPYSQAEAYAIVSMAQYQLKRTEDSRATLAKCAEVVESKMPKPESADLGGDWRDWIMAHALLTEAQNLIGTPPPNIDSRPIAK